MAALVATALHVPRYVAVLLGLVWGLITLTLDRSLVAEVVPIRAYSNGSRARTVLKLVPRLVLVGVYAVLLSSVMLLALFQREIDASLAQKGAADSGLLARLRVFEQLRHEQASLLVVQVLLVVLLFASELTPVLIKLLSREAGHSR
jgi:Domain of unknown function (DUF4407)